MKYKTFYRSFENKFRGSTTEIKKRLEVYLPIIKSLSAGTPNSRVLDIGCGRGEWLNLLYENSIQAEGIDLDDEMLEEAKENQLNVSKEDALIRLKRAADNEFLAVTGFHIIEHLKFEYLLDIINECSRVLVPGGIIIFETPNPEHLIVSTRTFYLDWTHLKPIPPDLLRFIYEHFNFNENVTLRLNESPISPKGATVHDIFFAVSPDYSIVGQKEGSDSLKEKFQSFKKMKTGKSLEDIVVEYCEK